MRLQPPGTVRDSAFLNNLNEFRPAGYPAFTRQDVDNNNSTAALSWHTFVNVSSVLCMDISNANTSNGTPVIQWRCNGEHWQKWFHDSQTQLIHSLQNPRLCLDIRYFHRGSGWDYLAISWWPGTAFCRQSGWLICAAGEPATGSGWLWYQYR